MTTLTDFLLARIADDEAAANDPRYVWSTDIGEPVQNPARVLAECAAHRQIVELHHRVRDLIEMENLKRGPTWGCVCYGGWPCATIRALATVYADHPDFRAEWAL